MISLWLNKILMAVAIALNVYKAGVKGCLKELGYAR
jgi:hypothetical protein